MRGRRVWAVLLLGGLMLSATGILPSAVPPARAATSKLVLKGWAPLAPGVDHLRYATVTPPNAIQVVRVRAGAKAEVVPVLSRSNVVAPSAAAGLETTSSMCQRAGGLACVNGDFTACAGCTAPLGGMIRHGHVYRTPQPGWPQLRVNGGRLSAEENLAWSGQVTADYRWTEPIQQEETGLEVPGVPPTEERTKSVPLTLSGVNVTRQDNSLVLYTPSYGASTYTAAGGFEVVVAPDSVSTVLGRTINLRFGRGGGGGGTVIPRNGFVLSASGRAASQLWAFVMETRQHPDRLTSLTLKMQTAVPTLHSLGGHPVILRQGRPVTPPGPIDHASRARHPRTLVGWNGAGDVWLVTVDGRQPGYSTGITYEEASAMLLQLGATDGINMDGGGSTTFVAKRCSGSVCVRNRPSDGRERPVTTALAVVPRR